MDQNKLEEIIGSMNNLARGFYEEGDIDNSVKSLSQARGFYDCFSKDYDFTPNIKYGLELTQTILLFKKTLERYSGSSFSRDFKPGKHNINSNYIMDPLIFPKTQFEYDLLKSLRKQKLHAFLRGPFGIFNLKSKKELNTDLKKEKVSPELIKEYLNLLTQFHSINSYISGEIPLEEVPLIQGRLFSGYLESN